MADDRDDDDADYRGLTFEGDYGGMPLDRQGDDEGRVFDDGRTLTSIDQQTSVDDEKRHKTLMELQHGTNGATAMQMIDEQVYKMAVASNFGLVRLSASSGAKHPRCFSEETRAFIQDKPVFQVRMPNGNPAPYVYVESKEAIDVDDDMRIPM